MYILCFSLFNVHKIIFSPLLVLGQLVIFYVFYNFPLLLELGWKENIVEICIIDSKRLKILFQYIFSENLYIERSFQQQEIQKKTEVFFSGGLIGIEDIIAKITDSKDKIINKIFHGEFLVLLSLGYDELDSLIFCVLIKKETKSILYFLNLIKQEFQNNYKTMIQYLDSIKGKEQTIFKQFNTIVNGILNKT